MKSLSAIILLMLFGISSPTAGAANHGQVQGEASDAEHADAEEQELLDAFNPLTELAGPLGMRFSTVIITDADATDSPMQMGYKDGICKLVIQVRNNPTYRRMLATEGKYSRQTKLRAMLTHEMGHCYRYFFREGASHPHGTESLAGSPTGASQLTLASDHDDELAADLFALAWSAAYNPQEFDDVYAFLQELRFSLLPADTAGLYASRDELAWGLQLSPATGPLNPKALPQLALLFLATP
jgi:hypothetical protein